MVPLFFFWSQALEVIQCAQDVQNYVTGKEHRVKGSDVYIEIGGEPAPHLPWEQQSQYKCSEVASTFVFLWTAMEVVQQ